MSKANRSFATADYSKEWDSETKDLCEHMLAHIKVHLGNYISQLENEQPKRS
jgi:hypothetical protein